MDHQDVVPRRVEGDMDADDPSPADTTVSSAVSRRRVLVAAGGAAVGGGAAVAAVLLPGRLSQQDTQERPDAPDATPTHAVATPAVTDPGGGLPLPSTLAADASPEFRAVAEALTESMRTNRVPGTALGILAGDREEHASFGVASMNTLIPVGPDTLFQIGSLTKTYTATVIWRLIDEGILALDAPVRTYIPDLRLQDPATAARVTVGNLLDHTAGWYGDEGTYTGEGDDGIARFVAERPPQLPQLFPRAVLLLQQFGVRPPRPPDRGCLRNHLQHRDAEPVVGSARVDRNGARLAGGTAAPVLGRALRRPDQRQRERGRAVPAVGAPLRRPGGGYLVDNARRDALCPLSPRGGH
jgi:hypothetical protein